MPTIQAESARNHRKSAKEKLRLAFLATKGPVIDASGKVTGIFGIFRDITERKLAENKLRLSEELYHLLVETSQDIIWKCDVEGRWTFLNLAAEQVFGYELHEMIGKKFSDFQTPENAERDLIRFNRLMQGEPVWHFESTYIGKYGNDIHLVINAAFVCDEYGEIVGASGTAHDITERKRMEEELNQAKAAAEAASIAKSHFLATMSHEIRTPMNGLLGMLQLLQQTGLADEQRQYVEDANNAGLNLLRLLNGILDLSKIEADSIELEAAEFELRPLISDIVNLVSPVAHEKGLELESSIDAKVPTALKGDSAQIRQIIINLLSNAIKFTPKGRVALQISKEAEDGNSTTLRILVRDSGIGIPADRVVQIFEPYAQAEDSTTRKYGGTGLGLAICKRLAELMGGGIGVESVEGEGSTFWFTVVVEKVADDRRDLNCESQMQIPLNPLLSKGKMFSNPIRILLADDDEMAQKIVPKLLKIHGYQVDVVPNGKAALQALQENDYALVLMDCMMPEMSGYETTAAVRHPASTVRRCDVPIIALTGNAMKEDVERCISAGMDDHLPKPLVLEALLEKLEKWVA